MNIRRLAAVALLSACLSAQDQVLPPIAAATRPAPITVTLQFGGGTMSKFVRAVREAQPKANIVVAAKAADVMLPPIDLRNAGVEQSLQGACEVVEGDVQVRVREWKGDGEPVYSIVANETKRGVTTTTSATSQGDAVAATVLALGRLTDAARQPAGYEPLRVETVLSAIEAATDGDKNPPVLRYHRDSGLLIVRGTQDQRFTVEMVLSVLERDRAPARGRSNPVSESKEERQPKDR